MGYIPLGQFGTPLFSPSTVFAGNIRGGTITAQELIIGGGTKGVIRSQNYDGTATGWAIFGDGTAFFGSSVVVAGDIYSSSWDGAIPADLSAGPDQNATAGYYLDSSAGSIHLEGDIWIDGQFGVKIITGFAQVASFSYSSSNNWAGISSGVDLLLAGTGISSDVIIRSNSVGTSILFQPASLSLTKMTMTVTNSAFLHSIVMNNGTALLPGLATTDLNTGWFRSGTDVIQHTVNGTATQQIYNYGLLGLGTSAYLLNAGVATAASAAAPVYSFSGDANTGMYRWTGDHIGFATGGTQAGGITSIGTIRMKGFGTTGNATFTFVDDLDTGMYRYSTNRLGFTAAGYSFSSTAANFYMYGARNNTTGSAANTLIQASDGRIFRSTSLRAHKSRITYNVDYLADLELKPVKFYRKDDSDWFYGFIAEDFSDQDTILGEYSGVADDLEPDEEPNQLTGYDSRAVMAIMAAKINRLEKLVAQL